MSSVDPISVRLVLFFSVPSCVCDLDFPAHAGRSLPSSPPCPRALSQIGCLCSAFPSDDRPLRSIEIEKFGKLPPLDLPLSSRPLLPDSTYLSPHTSHLASLSLCLGVAGSSRISQSQVRNLYFAPPTPSSKYNQGRPHTHTLTNQTRKQHHQHDLESLSLTLARSTKSTRRTPGGQTRSER